MLGRIQPDRTEPSRIERNERTNARAQVDVEILLPRMQGICEFMLAAQQDPDPEVRPFAVGLVLLRCCWLFCVDSAAPLPVSHRDAIDVFIIIIIIIIMCFPRFCLRARKCGRTTPFP